MNKFYLFILLCILSVLTLAVDVKEEDDVAVLNQDNFDEFIRSNKFVLVEYYSPGCGHCVQLAPIYAKAAKKLKASGCPAKLAKVDATKNSALAERVKVQGYPTLKFFYSGKPINYDGERTETSIVNWVKAKSESVVRLIETAEDLAKFQNEQEVFVLFWGDKEHADYNLFEKAALDGELGEMGFFESKNLELRGDSTSLMTIFKKFDEGRADFEGEAVYGKMKSWIKSHELPTLIEYNAKVAPKITGLLNVPSLYLFYDEKSEGMEEILVEFRKAAERLKGTAYCAKVNAGKYKKITERFGVKSLTKPSLRLENQFPTTVRETLRFTLQGDITADKIVKFVSEAKDKHLKPDLRSEDVPAENDGIMKKVVGTTFKDIVLDTSKDVVLLVDASWCDSCKTLASELEKTAKKINRAYVVFARMDGVLNEVDGISAKSYPLLQFYPSTKKNSPFEINFARDEPNLTPWIKAHITKKVAVQTEL
jgi:protein disulfide-isomerase A1